MNLKSLKLSPLSLIGLLIVSFLGSASVLAAETFTKIGSKKTPDVLSESKLTAVSLDQSLQPVRGRSLDMMRAMLGAPVDARAVGPSLQAEWSHKLSPSGPIFLSSGVGYSIENKKNDQSQERNFHHVPIFATAGYQLKPIRSWRLSGEAGPAVRYVFERGFTADQTASYSYGDLLAQVSAEYEWNRQITGAGRAIGVRFSRYFGLPGNRVAEPVDALFASFGFDL